MSDASRLFSAPRLMPDAGYGDDPGPIPYISKLLIPGTSPKVARDVSIAGRRFELWSPNSRRLPFYPGIKTPGVDLEDLSQGKKSYDGHLGPLDPTYHPQHYQPRRPYLPFVRRHSHLNPPSQFPEFVSLFDSSEAWSADASSESGRGHIPGAYIDRLRRRNAALLREMETVREELRNSHRKENRVLWTRRPLYVADASFGPLYDIVSFEDALDSLTAIQRAIKLRDAWVSYARLKCQAPWDQADMPYLFIAEGNEQYMGVWMSDEVFDDALLYLTRAGVACFFLHEYTTEEAAFHHRTHTPYPDPVMQNYALISAEDGPWRRAVSASRLRPLILSEGESVGRVQRLPSTIPRAGSLSLSNRQGYRLPSLRNESSTPVPVKLAELESRPLTPVMMWSNADGLNTDLPPALSLAEAKARHAAQTNPVRSTEAVETAPTDARASARAKGKRRQSPSYSLSDYESDRELVHAAVGSGDAVSRESQDASGPSATQLGSEDPALTASSSALSVESERAKELYAAYPLVISEFWRIDSLPRDCLAASDLLSLLKEAAKKTPFAVRQILRTWRRREAVYWVHFGNSDQALRVRGYLSRAGLSNTDGCDGPLVAESTYLLALEEVRHPEVRPLSPTGHWNLPVDIDARFAEEHTVTSAAQEPPSRNASLPLPAQASARAEGSREPKLKSNTPDTYTTSTRSPPSSPISSQAFKRSRIHSPPRQFIASRSTRAVRQIPHAYNRNHKSLSERIDLESPSHPNDSAAQSRLKGSDSRYAHNRQRYHRKQYPPLP